MHADLTSTAMPAEREKGQLAAGGAGRKVCAHRHHFLERLFGPPTGIEVMVNASGHGLRVGFARSWRSGGNYGEERQRLASGNHLLSMTSQTRHVSRTRHITGHSSGC
eukprot:scaffold111098_cov36-Phaeocystis_antarctica.AAC.1